MNITTNFNLKFDPNARVLVRNLYDKVHAEDIMSSIALIRRRSVKTVVSSNAPPGLEDVCESDFMLRMTRVWNLVVKRVTSYNQRNRDEAYLDQHSDDVIRGIH